MTTTAVRVALRVRPIFNQEEEQDSIISFIKDEPQIFLGMERRSFTFDFVYSPTTTQEELYNSSITPLLDRFTEGKNVTILAYGQTGSGKTYSMGTSLETCANPIDQGIIHRFSSSLFNRMNENNSSSKSLGKDSFQIYVSFLEVYNEDINDLLNAQQQSHFQNHSTSTSSSSIVSNHGNTYSGISNHGNSYPAISNHGNSYSGTSNHDNSNHPIIREDVQGNIYWTGVREERVNTLDELIGYLKKGIQQRTTGSTEMNSSSSRSHAIFSIILKQVINDIPPLMLNLEEELATKTNLVSKFHFVDLAGSERLKRTNALGERQKEGIFINSGLLALGNVISALGDESRRKNQHIPYRDSKLTRLLQDSLGGNSHTLMLACVSPSSLDYTETLNTLKYANRARNIQNRVEINEYFNGGSSEEEIQYMRTQISRLKSQVNTLKDNNEIKLIKDEMENIKVFSQQILKDLAEAQSERDSLLLKLEQNNGGSENIQAHPMIQEYAKELQTLRLQVAETQSKLDAIHHNHVLNDNTTTLNNSSSKLLPILNNNGREHKPTKSYPLKAVSSFSSFQYDETTNKKLPNSRPLSTSSSRKLLNTSSTKKRPIFHRMKSTQSSTSLLQKKKLNQQNHHKMDELLELLRKEYLLQDDEEEEDNMNSRDNNNEKFIDETVLHTSHEDNAMTMQKFSFRDAELNQVFPKDNNNNNTKISMPDTPISPTSHSTNNLLALDDDGLEALSVPSWSDAPSLINNSAKRKSISLDSMWDDTDSSMTTSRKESTTTHHRGGGGGGRVPNNPNGIASSKSKDMRRQGKNLLKMLHQIQADLLVKRELVGQLEKSEDQYTQMRVNYEERLDELKNHLFEIQNQRDEALKKSGTTIVPKAAVARPQSALQLRENRQAQEVRSQYEVKLKRLISENQELKKKHAQSTQSIQTARSKAEGIIGRLRADIEALKLDKKQLNKGMKMEADRARETISNCEREVQQLKRREAITLDAKKKLQETNEAQNQILKKRTEETAAANMQLRQLTNVLRRAANEGTLLNEVALEKILSEANNNSIPTSSPSPKNTIRRPTLS